MKDRVIKVVVDEGFHERIKAAAALEKRSVSQFMRLAALSRCNRVEDAAHRLRKED